MVKKTMIFAAAVMAIAAGYYFLIYESDAQKVKKTFHQISGVVEKKMGENPIIGAAKAKQISEVLSDTCTIDDPSRSISRSISSHEISSFIFARRNEFEALTLGFHDITITFENEITAIADFTVVLEGTLKTGDDVEEAHELNCTLKKMDDTWRISEIVIIEVLEP